MATKYTKPTISSDFSPHHTSPTPGDVQTPFPKPPEKNVQRKIGKLPSVPMHVTKHPNPVGRPKNPRY